MTDILPSILESNGPIPEYDEMNRDINKKGGQETEDS